MTLTSQAATNPPLLTASALLDNYTQALDSTRSFASTSESTNVLNSRVPSWGLQMSNALSFTRAEENTDGRGRLYSKSLHWGHVDGSPPTACGNQRRI